MRQVQNLFPSARSEWGEAMDRELEHIGSDTEALRWAFGCLLACLGQKFGQEFRAFAGAARRPAAFIPIAMSLAALAVILVRIALVGTARDQDEGAVAHAWQLLMAGQVPVLAWFAFRWLPRTPKGAVYVILLQGVSALAAMAPVFLLGL